MAEKPAILFVGSFKPAAADGTVGGQMFACRALLASPLGEQVRWRLIDTTMRSLPPPGMLLRACGAWWRLTRGAFCLLRPSTRALLVFSSYHLPSLLEKGALCLWGGILGKRVVLSLRSEVARTDPRKALRLWARLVFGACDRVICQSQAAEEGVLSHFSHPERARVLVIPNWVDAAQYAGDAPRPPDAGCRFLFMGWVQRTKGINELFEAVRLLMDAGRDFEVDVCGRGPDLEELQKRVEDGGLGGRVHFRGWIHDRVKVRALRSSRALLLPSYTEGMPNCVLEAMAAETAVIASRVGGVPELLEDGVSGILIPKKDSSALAQAMMRMMDEPEIAARMGREGRKRVLLHHDIERVWPKVALALGVIQDNPTRDR